MSTAIRSEDFRSVLGRFATGVTVVTGMADDRPVGFTCQSFSALSLEPPLVVLLPARSSTSWPHIAHSGHFCVNVLAAHQEPVSAAFARSGTDKFADVGWRRSPSGAPILDDACAWLDCRIGDVFPGGDHWIVVGAVEALDAEANMLPLLFHRGTYARIAT